MCVFVCDVPVYVACHTSAACINCREMLRHFFLQKATLFAGGKPFLQEANTFCRRQTQFEGGKHILQEALIFAGKKCTTTL